MNDSLSESPHPILSRSERLRSRVASLRWRCLDDTWSGWHTRHRFLCGRGHELNVYPSVLLRGKGFCEQCRCEGMLQDLHEAANRDGVTCLESQWKGVESAHRFRCACGHEWLRAPKHMLSTAGRGACPRCTAEKTKSQRRLVDGLQRLQTIAAGLGGQCLSDAYLGGLHRYRFKCARDHQWDAIGAEVLRGSWCGTCADEHKRHAYLLSDGLERLHAAAADKGGCCESDAYLGKRHRYRFRCGNGHRWEAVGGNVLNGSWCLECTKDSKRLSIEAAHEAARARGGECLSSTYINAATKLSWVCDRGHLWHAPLSRIRRGHWCRECANAAQIANRKSKARIRYNGGGRHAALPE
ncbi:hypothetical protein [Eleftheria terrae]|uniref:hypothetical protein n=1 Tax=Eleftheria terrae TaxID=1597781 RepID=UPI00263B7B54|nr:hypothetical protein [Eleftheria terrae]WKB50893.1 hypothetical protein N7L95_13840 [Eleftheria terrae]